MCLHQHVDTNCCQSKTRWETLTELLLWLQKNTRNNLSAIIPEMPSGTIIRHICSCAALGEAGKLPYETGHRRLVARSLFSLCVVHALTLHFQAHISTFSTHVHPPPTFLCQRFCSSPRRECHSAYANMKSTFSSRLDLRLLRLTQTRSPPLLFTPEQSF